MKERNERKEALARARSRLNSMQAVYAAMRTHLPKELFGLCDVTTAPGAIHVNMPLDPELYAQARRLVDQHLRAQGYEQLIKPSRRRYGDDFRHHLDTTLTMPDCTYYDPWPGLEGHKPLRIRFSQQPDRDGSTCVLVKIGERQEVTSVPVYEVRCPEEET